MINKVVGYAGFQSYGELPYATLKPGKQQMPENQIWESTARDVDNKPHLQNYHNLKTVYRQDYLQNTNPKDYYPSIVQKGSNGFQDYPKANSIPNYETMEAKNNAATNTKVEGGDSLDIEKQKFLKTGVEHWKSNYKHQVDDLNNVGSNPSKTVFGQNGSANSNLNATTRSQSANKTNMDNYRGKMPEWSKNNYMYMNNAPMGTTEYKFNIGGRAPTEVMDRDSAGQPRIYNPLKAGTTQLVEHIPGYQGFLPASRTIGKAFEHSKGQQTRTTFQKNNLIQNYHVHVPGYTGFKPKANIVDDHKLRSSCFNTNELIGSSVAPSS